MLSSSVLMDIATFRPYVRVPYVRGMLRAETREAVLDQDPLCEFSELDRGSPTAYARWLIEDWARKKTTIIIEQDVVPPPTSLTRLLYCHRQWCTHPAMYDGHVLDDTLCLVKFGEALKRERPELMEHALLGGGGSYLWTDWRMCDRRISTYFRARGYEPCVHQPKAVHLHYEKT